MVTIFLDLLGGWISGRYIPNLLLAIFGALLLGAIASVTGAYLIYLIGGDMFTEREIAARAAAGLVWHPLITLVATLLFRRKFRKKKSGTPNEPA